MSQPPASLNGAGNAAPAVPAVRDGEEVSAHARSLADSQALPVDAVAPSLAQPGTAAKPKRSAALLIQRAASTAASLQSDGRGRPSSVRLRDPRTWSRRARTVLVLAFPVALPAWAALLVLVAIRRLIVALARGLHSFCAAPPRARRRYAGTRYP